MELTEATKTTTPDNYQEIARELFFLIIRQAIRDIGAGFASQEALKKPDLSAGLRSAHMTQVRRAGQASSWFGSEAFEEWCDRAGYEPTGYPLSTLLAMSDEEKVKAFKKAGGEYAH